MFYLKTLAQWVAVVFEMIRGHRTLKEITESRAQIESLIAHSVDGYTTTIHCQERSYVCTYARWPMFNRVVKTYFVFATVQGLAPKPLVEACSMDRSFPELLHPWMPNASQKEAAIEAYIDLLVAKLENNVSTVIPTLPQE